MARLSGQRLQSGQGGFETSSGVRQRRASSRLRAGQTKIVHGLLMQRALDGMMRKPVDLLAQAFFIQLLDGVDDTRMDFAAAFAKHPAIGNLLGQGVLEIVLQIGKHLRGEKKLAGLQSGEQGVEHVFRQPGDGPQQHQRDLLPNNRRDLQQAPFGGGQRVDARGEHRQDRGRDLAALERLGQPIAATLAFQDAAIGKASYDLLDEETGSRWRARPRSPSRSASSDQNRAGIAEGLPGSRRPAAPGVAGGNSAGFSTRR